MADQASKDAEAKGRIIRHMNADHQRSLSYYLQHYNHLSSSAASKPLLVDITFDSLKIQSADGKTHAIPLNPPMKSWSEARTRTVDMDREARAALDISPVQITEYEPPKTFIHRTIAGLCMLAFTTFLTREWIVEGTLVHDQILPWFPGGPKWFLGIARAIAVPVVLLHMAETYLLDKTRLKKYGVERGTSLWYKWVGSCLIEGFACFQRIDAAVKKKTLEAEKAKH